MSKATIIVEDSTRQKLRQIGRKEQTYDQVINELIQIKRKGERNA
jgi:predicted CopG family antitoxin